MHAIEQFWQAYSASCLDETARDEAYIATQFGDTPALADALSQLIVQGIKTATCSALWAWHAEGSPLPEVGMKTIVLNSQHEPVCSIETTEITIRPYDAVDHQFASDKGEDDRSLAAWRTEHWTYFSRVLPRIGRQPAPDMPLVCERFRVVYPVR